MYRVLEINDPKDLSYVQGNWQRLWNVTSEANFFQTLAWLQIYWKHFSENKTLRVIAVLENDHMIGIVPLVVVEERTRLGTVRVLTYPLADWGTRFGPIAEKPEVVLAQAFKHLRKSECDWDMIDLRWIPESDLEEAMTSDAMSGCGFRPQTGLWKETLCVDLDGNWNDYLRNRSPKLRSEIRRKLRKFENSGKVKLERYRPSGKAAGQCDPRWDLFKRACEIAESSWQGSSETGTTLSHRQIRSFLKDCHLAAVEAGMLDLAILYFDSQPVSFCYNYCHEGQIYGLRRGDSPLAREHGLGTVMTAMVIRDGFERGDTELDMGPGSFEAKRRWMTRIASVGRVAHYRLTQPKVQLLRLKHWWQASQDLKSGRLRRSLCEKDQPTAR